MLTWQEGDVDQASSAREQVAEGAAGSSSWSALGLTRALLGVRRWPGSWRRASTSTQSHGSLSMAAVLMSGPTWPVGSSSTRSTHPTCAGSSRCLGSSK